MVTDILTAAGLPYRRGRFPSPPKGSYIVYTDDQETIGADLAPWTLIAHEVTLELYEASPDDAAEAAVEASINAHGLTWTKQDRYWLQSEQRYQVVYEIEYTEKRRT